MNNNEISISVIVPIYGIENYLNQCVDSIINQSYNNIEIILVDDGSKDRCPSICDDFAVKDHRIIVVHKENGGLVSARKAGIKKATGDYICHVDGDDWLQKDYIKNFVDIIEKYTPDIVCSGAIRAYPDKEIITPLLEREGFYNREQIDREIIPSLLERKDGYYFSHVNQQKCVKRGLAVMSLATVDNAISMSEDHACTSVAITNAESIYVSKKCQYYYRIVPNSMTNSKKTLPWSYPYNMSQHFVKHLDLSRGDLKEQYYRAISHFLFNTIVSQFNSNRSFREICKDIDCHIIEYAEQIHNARYSKLSHKIMTVSLRHNLHLAFKLYAIIRYRQ